MAMSDLSWGEPFHCAVWCRQTDVAAGSQFAAQATMRACLPQADSPVAPSDVVLEESLGPQFREVVCLPKVTGISPVLSSVAVDQLLSEL